MAKRRRKRKKESKLVPNLILMALLGIASFFLVTHKEEVRETVQEKSAAVDEYFKEKAPTVTKGIHKGIQGIKDLAGKGVEKSKETLDALKEQYSDEETIQVAELDSDDGEQLKICSFNVRVFSDKSRDDSELAHIADILDECDITALQELRDEKVLNRTVKKLKERGFHYDYEISPKVGRGVKEIYAFLYKKGKVVVKEKGRLYKESDDEFIREPYYATFQSGNFDFTLLTIHLLYGNSKKHRRPELLELAKVYDYVQNRDPNEQDIIVLGDFNFAPDDKGWEPLRSVPTMTHLIDKPEKTTITDTSLYDNFWFQKKFVKEFAGRVGIDKFDETRFNNDDRAAKLTVSDHRPIWAIFDIQYPDDD